VADVLRASRVTDGSITPDGLRWLIERCIAAGHVDQLDLPGLKPERRAVLPGGLAILYTLAAHFRIDALRPAKGALRQGVIVDLHDRLRALQPRAHGQDMRDESVRGLQQRFQVDAVQSARVARLALALYAQVEPEAGTEDLHELRWAAELHEMGLMVSHHDHHRHSAYLLAHVDAAGFSQSQQRRISELVLGQRGGLRKLDATLHREGFALQLLCLRLAVIACHGRTEVGAQALRLKRRGAALRLMQAGEPAALNPRTQHLLREEAATWSRSGVLDLVLAA
jgi:exopolyphosphatase/guanosine-5'-triphosphate,3'-diphosphate pyrophosphatase